MNKLFRPSNFKTIDDLVDYYNTITSKRSKNIYKYLVEIEAYSVRETLSFDTNIPSEHDLLIIRAINDVYPTNDKSKWTDALDEILQLYAKRKVYQ